MQFPGSNQIDVEETIRKWKLPFLIGFSIVYLLGSVLIASRKLLWNDELFTFYISLRPTIRDIWSALLTGTEQIPPLFFLLTRASLSLFGVNSISIRLPEIIGFWIMCFCSFQFVSRRAPSAFGFVALLFPLITRANSYCAYEARPYGIVLGFSGLALLCWQSATEKENRRLWLIGLFLSISMAIANHYYAVLIYIPLVGAELIRSLSRKRLDLPIWSALALGLTPLILFWPLISSARTYSHFFWGRPHWSSMILFYDFLLRPALLPLVAILVAAPIYYQYPRRRTADALDFMRISHELAAVLGFIAIPIFAVLVGKFVTNAFSERYAIPAVIGISVLVAFVACSLFSGRAAAGAVIAFIFFGTFLVKELRDFSIQKEAFMEQARILRLLESDKERYLPIVIGDPHLFFELSHYAKPDLRSRLIYLASREQAIHYVGTDHVDRGLLELKEWAPLNVQDYSTYVSQHGSFLLYWNNRDWSWVLSALDAKHAQITLKARNGSDFLFRVESPIKF